VLACSMAERVGPTGSVVGVDVNEGMLAAAKRKAPTLEWPAARTEALPFAENSFDAVVSKFGLMFFEDQRLALQEIKRVLRRGGRLAVAVVPGIRCRFLWWPEPQRLRRELELARHAPV